MLAFNILRQSRRRFSRGYYGIVLKVDDDSSKCKVYALGVLEQAVDDLPWASVANSFGNETHGTVFTPRIGSKVIVTFPTGDANHPLITPGWNASPTQFDSPGTQHGWQDNVGNYLKVDEQARTFTLHLATGAEITVDAENKMTIKATNICVQAEEDIDMEAGGNINITAAGDVVTGATNVTVAATATVSTEAVDVTTESASVTTTAAQVATEATNVTVTAALVDTQAGTISSAATGPHTITGAPVALN